MHVHRPGTDQNLELTFMINGVPATEYELPSASATASSLGYLDTYVAVKPSDRISLKWTWTGSLLHGQFDLVADGTLVRENRIEGDSQTGAVKYVKKTQKFDTGLDCPTPEGWFSVEPNKDLFEGNLVVADLEVESLNETPGGRRPGVGSLVFVASVNQQTLEQYHDQEKSIEMGSWKKRVGDVVRQADIAPEFALELRLSSDDKIKSKRSMQHRQRWIQNRFGSKAWGKMCFYYRSAAAIERAGGVRRDEGHILEVEAWDDEDKDFVEVEPVKRAAPKRKGGAASDDEDANDSLFVSMRGTPELQIKQENMSDRATTPKPKKKKAKLGGALFGSAEKAQHREDEPTPTTELIENEDLDMDMVENEDADMVENEDVDMNEDGEVVDKDYDSQDDVEPTSSELAAAPEYDPSEPLSNDFAKELDSYNQQEAEGSESAPIDNTAIPGPQWGFPSSPPARQEESAEPSPGALPEANAATDPTSPTHDNFKLPTSIEIRNIIEPDGTKLKVLEKLFKDNGPYKDTAAADREFDKRIALYAKQSSDGKYYPKGMTNSAVAASTSKAASKPSTPGYNKRKAQREAAAAKALTKTKPAVASPRGQTKQGAEQPIMSDLPSSHEQTNPQDPTTAAPKRKPAAPPAPATPRSHKKRPRQESSTPGDTGSSPKSRKQYKEDLLRELADKKVLIKKAAEKNKKVDEEIAELERLNRAADQRLRDLEEDEDGEEESEEESESDMYED